MARKLDNLLEGIERKGGFRDASITSQAKYVTDLEEGIWDLSDKCGMWRVCSLLLSLIENMLLSCSGNRPLCSSTTKPRCCLQFHVCKSSASDFLTFQSEQICLDNIFGQGLLVFSLYESC